MKVSEMIALLQAQLEARGDVDVFLHGHYGEESETFEVMQLTDHPHDVNLPKDRRRQVLNVWTDICTG